MFRITALAALAASCGVAAAAPDVICGSLDDVNFYGTVGSTSAYAIGTTACNNGTVPLNWVDGTPNHPVICCTIYRLMDGRLEQLGLFPGEEADRFVGELLGPRHPPAEQRLQLDGQQ